jgi:hypothetical protein
MEHTASFAHLLPPYSSLQRYYFIGIIIEVAILVTLLVVLAASRFAKRHEGDEM